MTARESLGLVLSVDPELEEEIRAHARASNSTVSAAAVEILKLGLQVLHKHEGEQLELDVSSKWDGGVR